MLEKCMSLICVILLFFFRNQSTSGVKSSEDASVAIEIEKVGLADWESARPTWALTGTIAAGAVGLTNLKVGLADSG
jgi:hypothetical protein